MLFHLAYDVRNLLIFLRFGFVWLFMYCLLDAYYCSGKKIGMMFWMALTTFSASLSSSSSTVLLSSWRRDRDRNVPLPTPCFFCLTFPISFVYSLVSSKLHLYVGILRLEQSQKWLLVGVFFALPQIFLELFHFLLQIP